MKVYVLFQEENDYSYSDFGILKIFSSEKKANYTRDLCELICQEYTRAYRSVNTEMNLWAQKNPRPEIFLNSKSSKTERAKYLSLHRDYNEKVLNKRVGLISSYLNLNDEQKELAKVFKLEGYSSARLGISEHEVED